MPASYGSRASWHIAMVTSTSRAANYDLAIRTRSAPFSDAYIDRGVTLYRMGDFNRAFTDIATAKRVDD